MRENQGFYVQWIGADGIRQMPVLANGCRTYSDAVRWALAYDRPVWAKDETRFIVHEGIPRPDVDCITLSVQQAGRWG